MDGIKSEKQLSEVGQLDRRDPEIGEKWGDNPDDRWCSLLRHLSQ